MWGKGTFLIRCVLTLCIFEGEADCDRELAITVPVMITTTFSPVEVLVMENKDKFIGKIFLRPKPDVKFYLILDLKKINFFMAYNKFKMDTLKFMLNLITPLS